MSLKKKKHLFSVIMLSQKLDDRLNRLQIYVQLINRVTNVRT